MGFVHLHLHTEYSLLDGACKIDRLVARAVELGQTALAITDHGNMFGAVEFYKAAVKAGIKPLIGCEVYMAPRSLHDKQKGPDTTPYHLILLCKNEVGYQNLIWLVSQGWTEGFYNRPRIDRQVLAEHSEGLVALSACLFGEVASRVRAGDYEGALQAALWHRSVFGEDYYLELQNQNIPDQKGVNEGIRRIARQTGIPPVATNDVHYIRRQDAEAQKILVCIQTNTTVNDGSAMEFPTQEFYLKSEAEMAAAFPDCPEALANTAAVAEKCNFRFEFGVTKLPNFDVPPEYPDHFDYLEKNAFAGLERRCPNPTQQARDRLRYELSTIRTMGYTDYFLIVADFIAYARSRGIPVGPGRGSGASSLVGYCLGITGVNPLDYGLNFERFLNPERVSMPDFDIDFCQERRQEVIDYVIEKYGADHVAQIVTFGTMKARAAIRDVGRALGMSYAEVDTVAKQIPRGAFVNLRGALEMKDSPLKQQCDNDPAAKKLVETAQTLEDVARNASTHAAGVVITREPVCHYVPLAVNGSVAVTQYTMNYLEELGLLKIDFLGLRNLTVIHHAAESVRQRLDPAFDIEKIPLDDAATYKLLGRGDTDGVFQLESGGMRQLLINMKPRNLEDLIIAISLYRPGPAAFIDQYLAGRADPKAIRYLHPKLENALRETNGVFTYQEQVTQACRDIAGYSYGQADMVRRAMAKKKTAEMLRQRQIFIHGQPAADGKPAIVGAVANGVDEKTANAIFDAMETFAGYGFNKCHAAPYALVAYQTAYLRARFYKEYMAALISSIMGDGKATQYINDCKKHGVKVAPPDVNRSRADFQPTDAGIEFGLLAVKNLGRSVIEALVRERDENGPYRSFYDFCSRMNGRELNSRALESLIKAGAFDAMPYTRRAMMAAAAELLPRLADEARGMAEGQMGLFDNAPAKPADYQMPKAAEYSAAELLAQEREVTGLFLSAHPLDQYEGYITARRLPDIASFLGEDSMKNDGRRVTLLGVILEKTGKQTRSGERMAFLRLEDRSDGLEAVIFPKLFAQVSPMLSEGSVIEVSGRLSVKESDDPEAEPNEVKLITDAVRLPNPDRAATAPAVKAAPTAANAKAGLYLRVPGRESEELRQAELILRVSPGGERVFVFFTDTDKLTVAPHSLWATVTAGVLKQLRAVLGEDNVRYLPE